MGEMNETIEVRGSMSEAVFEEFSSEFTEVLLNIFAFGIFYK